jgi:hypothetical protein
MAVLGFCGGGHCLAGHGEMLARAGADKVFADMADLPEMLRGLPETQNVV